MYRPCSQPSFVGVVYLPYDQFHVLGNVVWAVVFALFEPFRCDHQPYRFVRCFAFFAQAGVTDSSVSAG